MDTAARARQLALVGIEVRATQSASTGSGQGSGGQTAHEPAGSSKGGQFTSSPHGSGSGLGYQSILPASSAYKSGSGGAKKAAAAPANTPQPPATPRTMKVGDSGEDVRYAQYAMNLLGFKVAQDGNYGPETEAAVKQIQQRLGAKKPNGHLSSADLRKLQDAVRLSPCIGGGQRDLAFEAQWEERDLEDVDDVIDEDTEALIEALGAFIGADERSFTEALHPRNPKGSSGGGRFRSIVDRVVDALSEWKKGNGPDDPLKDFNREQLMKAAKAHGHTFRRGASIEEIKAQILDDVRNGTKAQKAEAPHLPGAPADHRRFTIQLGGKVDPGAVREVEVENKIRAAYREAVKAGDRGYNGYRVKPGATNEPGIRLSALRERIGDDVPRSEVDDALKRLSRRDGVYLNGDENQKTLTPEDHAAAVHIFGDRRDTIAFDRRETAPQPLPGLAGGTATDVGIFGNPTTGKLSLYRESDTGKRTGRAIKSFDDMGALESWARDNGHTELADYAKAEQARTGGAAKVAKAAEAVAAPRRGNRRNPGAFDPGAVYVNSGEDEGILRERLGSLDVEQLRDIIAENGMDPARVTSGWKDKQKLVDHVVAKTVDRANKGRAFNPLAGLEGLTPVQKRAALRKRGLGKAEIDALAPLEKPFKAFEADDVAHSLSTDIDNFLTHHSAKTAADRHAKGEAGIREKLAGLNVTQLRRVAGRFRFDQKAPTGVTAPQFLDWMLGHWAKDRGRWSLRSRELALIGVTRALGHDVTPGHDELHHYWTRGEGLAKWVGSPTQFRTLRAHLVKYVTPEQADRMAAAWVHEVTGFWPGSDMHRVLEGGKPRGHRIGRG